MAVMTLHADQIALAAPFHPYLSDAARQLKGRFRGKETGWVFTRDREDDLRALCQNFWGVDGTPEAAADTVTLRIETVSNQVKEGVWTGVREIWLCGRQIAVSMPERRAVRPGCGVKFLHGEPLSFTPTRLILLDLYLQPGTIFTIRDVPRMALPRFAEAIGDHAHWGVA